MFNLGMGELVVILVLALLVLGPKRLPQLATGLGKAIRDFRKATRDLQSHIDADETVAKPLQELRSALRDDPLGIRDITDPLKEAVAPLKEPLLPAGVSAIDADTPETEAPRPVPATGTVTAEATAPRMIKPPSFPTSEPLSDALKPHPIAEIQPDPPEEAEPPPAAAPVVTSASKS